MRDITQPPHICTIDPITLGLGGLALGGLAAGAATSGGGGSTPTPTAPPPQAPPQQKPLAKPTQQQPSFIGGIPAPPQATGQKTLLGQ
jgi:hypothetical protein